MRQKAQLMDEAALSRALMRISHEIVEKNKGAENIVLVGIRRRGAPIAERIRDNIRRIEEREVPVGSIDIRFYRDDLSRENELPAVRRAELPFDVSGRDVVLADDVIYTGRTVRAAIEAVFSWCWWTGATGSCPSGRTTWARTSPAPARSSSRSGSRSLTARRASGSWKFSQQRGKCRLPYASMKILQREGY